MRPARECRTAALLVVLVAPTSLLGLFTSLYAAEADAWRLEAQGQDIANLVSLPLLAAAACRAGRGSARGRLVWAGVLLFLVYAYVVYAFDLHFNRLFLVYVAILGVSFYSLLWAAVRFEPAAPPVPAVWQTRLVAGFLVVLPLLFGLLWLSEDIPAVVTGATPRTLVARGLLTNPVHVLDVAFLLPGQSLTGLQLWRRRPWGYALAVPLLVFLALTGVGIVAAMLLAARAVVPGAVLMGLVTLACAALAWLQLGTLGGSVRRPALPGIELPMR